MWQVFPFDFSGSSFDWALAVRVAMGVAIGGSAIAVVGAFLSFVKSVGRPAS